MNYEGCRGKSAKRFNIHTAWGRGARKATIPIWNYELWIMNYEGLPRKKREALNIHTAWGESAVRRT